jgi:hypothetical protein
MANLIIFISKKWPKNSLKITKFVCVCVFVFFVSFSEKNVPKLGRFPKKEKPHSDSKRGGKISISFGNFNIVFSENGNIVTIYSLFNFSFSYFCEILHLTKKSCTHYHLFLFSFMDCSDPSIMVWISDMMLAKSFILQLDEKTVRNNLFH